MWFVFALLGAVMAAISVTFTKAGLEKVNPFLAFAVEAVLILVISWSTVFLQRQQKILGRWIKSRGCF